MHQDCIASRKDHCDSQKDRTGNEGCNFSWRPHIILPFGIWLYFHAGAYSTPAQNAALVCLEHSQTRGSADDSAVAAGTSTHCADAVATWHLLELIDSRSDAADPASLAAVLMHCRQLVSAVPPALPAHRYFQYFCCAE
jgi:hypothetical protein